MLGKNRLAFDEDPGPFTDPGSIFTISRYGVKRNFAVMTFLALAEACTLVLFSARQLIKTNQLGCSLITKSANCNFD